MALERVSGEHQFVAQPIVADDSVVRADGLACFARKLGEPVLKDFKSLFGSGLAGVL